MCYYIPSNDVIKANAVPNNRYCVERFHAEVKLSVFSKKISRKKIIDFPSIICASNL